MSLRTLRNFRKGLRRERNKYLMLKYFDVSVNFTVREVAQYHCQLYKWTRAIYTKSW